ncbi:carboxypeptidase-like regulatory domain-containing protein [Xanthomarina sp. F1114]|uniref:carboxypeptidase-like regulatory domain-containing protein n=1 Tax=Xanthomarina sp. F1114 TaxID=2996019 RepID=UPI00225E4B71|nr:carboxypeptidase-like regulatory domain-containing protein [Xanthomarina sp. F1114]MCX7546842.1 carboxypeptidase-like regulatory domain-containing protein [Xanthomarina sp. F1114]
MSHWITIACVFICVLSSITGNAQIEISGRIEDQNNQALESANILVFNNKNELIGYAYTKKDGSYTLLIDSNKQTSLILSAQSLGFKTKKDTLNLLPNKKNYLRSFILQEHAEQLKEIVLRPDEKISREGRTTTIKVSAFKNDTEQTVEDILKSLPGIEVLQNGTIKAHGRYIDKLLIEGEDMFDKNYTILSKNLDAKVLDAVQILDGFEDNPILAKVIDSDKVAINLKLKDNYKNIWFGNIQAGLGTEDRVKLASNVGLIKKKIKFFNFNNYNNLGNKATEQLEGAPSSLNTNGSFREQKIEFDMEPIYTIQNNEVQFFNEGQSTFNKAFINALSFTTSLKSNLKLRGTGYFTKDNQDQLFSSETKFNTGTTPIFYSEYSNTNRKNSIAGGELELKYAIGEKSYLKNVFIYNNKPENTLNHSLFNHDKIYQNLKQNEYSVYNHLNYSYLIGEKNILHTYLYFGENSLEQNTILENPEISDIFTSSENTPVNNISNDRVSVYGGKSSMLLNIKKIKSTIEVGYESLKEYRKNRFQLLETGNNIEIDSLENNLIFNQRKLQLNTNLKYSVYKKVDLSVGLGLDYLEIDTKTAQKNKWLFNPKIRLSSNKLRIGYLSLSYIKNYNAPKSNLFLPHFQLNSFQSFIKGTKEVHFPQNNTFGLFYEINNSLKTQSISLRAQYITSDGKYTSENFIGQNIILSSYSFINYSNLFTSNISLTSYFKNLALSTNVGTSQNWSKTPIKANTAEFKDLKTYHASYFLSGTTYFKLPINFSFKYHLNISESNFNNIISKTHWNKIYLDTAFKMSDIWIASLKNNSYLMEDSNYYFLDFHLDFNPKQSKFSYQLILNNITNEKLFSITNIDEYSIYKSTVELLPRYLFVAVKYRF